jgi:hypothetical protein
MRNLVFALFMLAGGATGAPADAQADDAACVAAPTRACVLAMAAAAIATAGPAGDIRANSYLSTSWGAFVPRSLFVNETRGRIIDAAVRAGDIDLALSVASGIKKGEGSTYFGPLVVALELAGRKDELSALAARTDADPKAFYFPTGAALAAAGRSQDIEAFFKPKKFDPWEIASMQIAGALMSGKANAAPDLIAPFKGNDRVNALTQALSILRADGREAAGAPLIALRGLKTLDDVAYCGRVAAAAKDAALAESCFKALSALSENDKKSFYFGGTVVPEVIGALAAAGDWRDTPTLLSGLAPDEQMRGFFKLSQYARNPEFLPFAKKALMGDRAVPNPVPGDFLVRMLVLAGEGPEAAKFVAAAPDAATRDEWGRRQAEALAETGATAEAMKVASTIADGASRANALAAIAEALKN